MAIVRTIQHPGIQVQESQIGNYSRTVTMNNAYVMGFTDRGPIYDFSMVTSQGEFTRIYGQPQTQAQKYLFTAVQSILNNGGTPVVARMPYDNRQCKAYKAVKMKWGDVTSDSAFDLSAPVVPLSGVAGQINVDRAFSQIFTSGDVTVNGQAADQDFINGITVMDAVKLLSPYRYGTESSGGELYDGIQEFTSFRINGSQPSGLGVDQGAVSSMVESCERDLTKMVKLFNSYDQGFNEMLCRSDADVSARFCSNFSPYQVRELYLQVNLPSTDTYAGLSAYVNLFGTSTAAPATTGFLSGYQFITPADLDQDALCAMRSTQGLSAFVSERDTVLASKMYRFDVSNVFNGNFISSGYSTVSAYVKAGDAVLYFDGQATGRYAVTTRFDGIEVFNNTSILQSGLSAYVSGFVSGGVVSDTLLKAVIPTDTLGRVNGSVAQPDKLAGYVTSTVQAVSGTAVLDTLYVIYQNSCNGYYVDQDGVASNLMSSSEVPASALTGIVGFFNADVQSPAISGTVTYNGTEYPVYSKDALPGTFTRNNRTFRYIDMDNTSAAGHEFKSVNFINANDRVMTVQNLTVTFVSRRKIEYTTYLKDIPVVDIENEMLKQNQHLVWLRVIYNDPYFIDRGSMNTAKLQAALMTTPEMGFKYGLYLDSQECQISNSQYDDLVTVNQFKAVDRSVDKYGDDIDDANFIIVDKQKTVVGGQGGNIGYFTAIVDPFDALKVQRLLVNPSERVASERTVITTDENGDSVQQVVQFDHTQSNVGRLDYWAYESADAWNTIYDEIMDRMDTLQRVRNADGIYIGQANPVNGKLNINDTWSVPLTGSYYEQSVSRTLMKKFPVISMSDVNSDDLDSSRSIIDHSYMTHILVAVCKTAIDQTTGLISVQVMQTFFGSVFSERNQSTGKSLFIGDVINGNSNYIEFYRNDYVSTGDAGAYDPAEYRRTDINQIFIKDSDDLKNAAQLRGIDADDYGCDSIDPVIAAAGEQNYIRDLQKKHIYVVDKSNVCVYNLHWQANLTSFSKKESQKVIANTSDLYSVNDGTTINVAKNFLIDMDRCINFIKNVDDIPIHFVCDAGISTIAQFCDNVVWNPNKLSVTGEKIDPVTKRKNGVKTYVKTGGWITQPFDPDNDPDSQDRYITEYSDIATWRKVAQKLDSISSNLRKDCFTIIDAPRQLTLDGAAPKLRRSKYTNTFDKTIGKALRFITGFNSSYSAGYYNWLRTTDTFTGNAMWIPPTSKIIGNYCYLNVLNLPWLAPAGLTYGVIDGCYAVSHNPSYNEQDQIYMKSWNYIKQYPMEGFVVEGQKTLLGKQSVFERVNVRLLFLDLERYTYNVAKTFKYQVNNQYTRQQFVATLKPKFEDYVMRGGIYEYYIKVDSENNTAQTIDNNELRGDIFIKPARLIEFILLNFVGTTTNTDFTELQLGN